MQTTLRTWRWLTRALTLMLAATLVACGSGGSDEAVPPPPPPPPVTGTVSGLVVSAATGQPLVGATAMVGALSATTGADGRFTLALVPPGAVVVAVSAADHTRNFANASVVVGQTASISTRLSRLGVRQTYSAAAGVTVAVAGTPAQVVLPPAGIVDRNGAAYSGNVTVEVSPIDPARDPANMPGDMTTRVGGELQSIESFGAMAVVLTDPAGNRLNLAAGQTSTIRIPLATRSAAPPATVPLFFFNESTGLWVQEGTATLLGTAPNQYYEGRVSHFTVWNADQVMQSVTVSGCVRDAANAPVAGAIVRSDGLDYSGTSSAVTNATGNFSIVIRRGSQASIFASIDARFSNSVTAGPSEGLITLANCLTLGNGTPVFVVQPMSQSVTEGGFVVFQAVARGTAPLRYRWQRNGVDITGATTSVLLVDPVGNADSGAAYRAVATNNVGSANSDAATITVAPLPPAIDVQPQPQAVVAGSSATFSVQMRPQGAPLQFQWRRNGADIQGAIASSYTLTTSALSDSGASFSVRISNSVGAVVSAAAALTVTPAPVPPGISQQPVSVSVNVGQSAQFSVTASGSAPLRYEWRRGSTVIATATGPTLSLATTALSDNGAVFSVVVRNDVGSATSANATLTVTEPPVGAGYHLIATTGATADGSMVFANGAQTISSQTLVAVRADDPAAGPVTVEVAGAATYPFAQVIEATLQNNILSNIRQRYSFYFKNARLMRLDSVSASGAPVGQPVSSLTSAGVCAEGGFPINPSGLTTLDDIANPQRSWVLLLGPGADGQCLTQDDAMLAVRADMSGSQAPVTVPGTPLQEITDTNGALVGVIVRVGQVLRRLDANFANPTDLLTLAGTGALSDDFIFGSSVLGNWAFLDNGVLYGYAMDGSSGAPRALVTLSAQERLSTQIRTATQAGMAYVAISDGTVSRIVRIDGSLTVTASGTGPASISQLLASPTRLVFVEQQTLSSQPLAGGTRETLVQPANATDFLSLVFRSGQTLYYTRQGLQQGEVQAVSSVGIINTDGSNPQTLAATAIVSALVPASISVADLYDESVYAFVIAQGLTAEGQYAGSSLRAIEGSSRTTLVNYGSVPAQPTPSLVFPADFGPFQYGLPGLLTLLAVAGDNVASDLLFYDSDAPGLLRLTNSIGLPLGAAQRPVTRLGMPKSPPPVMARPGLRGVLGLRERPATPSAAGAATRR